MSVSSTMSVLSTVLSSGSKTITQSDVDNMSESELKDYLDRQDFLTKIKIAKKGIGLKHLVFDSHFLVRKEVARQGYGLTLLIDDPDEDVRVEVAKHGFGLDKLKNDESEYVLAEVKLQLARQKST